MILSRFISVVLILLFSVSCYAQEIITDFTSDSTVTLNNELRQLNLGTQIKSAGKLDVYSYNIENVNTPTTVNQAVNKNYVDTYRHSGEIIQIVSTMSTVVVNCTTAVPYDNTKPLNSEGDQVMSCSITPTSATNTLKIDAVVFGSVAGGGRMVASLYKNSDTTPLASGFVFSEYGEEIPLVYTMTSATTSTITFKINLGDNTGTAYFNDYNAGGYYGGALTSSLSIAEIKT